MAADTYSAPSFADPALFNRGSIVVRASRFDLTDLVGAAGSTIASGLLEDNDVIKVFKLPPDVKILWARVDAENLDSGANLVWDLVAHNGTTTKYLIQSGVAGAAEGFTDTRDDGGTGVIGKFATDSAIGWVVDNDNYYVQLAVTTAPAGAGEADPTVEVEIAYTCQLESGDAAFRT